MNEIYIYTNIEDWDDEKPNSVIKGRIEEIKENYVKISDENGLTQVIILNKIFALVY